MNPAAYSLKANDATATSPNSIQISCKDLYTYAKMPLQDTEITRHIGVT